MFLQKRIDRWQRKTFPASTIFSKIDHLRLEVDELETECSMIVSNKKRIASELGDCFLLLIGIAGLLGISFLKAIKHKFKINKKRLWKKPVNGVYFHEKDHKVQDCMDQYKDCMKRESKSE